MANPIRSEDIVLTESGDISSEDIKKIDKYKRKTKPANQVAVETFWQWVQEEHGVEIKQSELQNYYNKKIKPRLIIKTKFNSNLFVDSD